MTPLLSVAAAVLVAAFVSLNGEPDGRDILARLKTYETVSITTRQFHFADNPLSSRVIYPDVGAIEFRAFGQSYKVRLQKNKWLIPEDGLKVRVRTPKGIETSVRTMNKHCHYIGSVVLISDQKEEEIGPSKVALSMCAGKGVRGWIRALNQTLVIRPEKYLTLGRSYKGRYSHRDRHIVYRYGDLDRSMYHHMQGGRANSPCGHDHPATEMLHENLIRNRPDLFPKGKESLIEQGLLPRKKGHHSHHGRHHGHHQHHGHHDEHSHSDSEERADILLDPDSEESKELMRNIVRKGKDASDLRVKPFTGKRRRMQTSNVPVRYVELLVIDDPGRYLEYLDDEDNDADAARESMLDSDISIVNTLSGYYSGSQWGDDVGTVQIILSVVEVWTAWDGTDNEEYEPTALVNSRNGNAGASCDSPSQYSRSDTSGDYCEVDYDDYLAQLHSYRTSGDAPDHDNAQLFSGYDFYDSVIGYANLPGMCSTYRSGGIEQCTYSDEYNGNIVAHEMGHNFDMSHDGSSNGCDPEEYIMASVGNPGWIPGEFSSCSVDYMADYFEDRATTLSCLDNEPYETQYAVCGNGFKEQGESCDCGSDDCSTSDPCCDGTLCQLFGDADCSSGDRCCTDCRFSSAGTTCRAKSSSNGCDIEAETCSGTSSDCPSDAHLVEGEVCYNPLSTDDQDLGYCYNAECKSMEQQCIERGEDESSSNTFSRCDHYGVMDTGPSGGDWKTDDCRNLDCFEGAVTTCTDSGGDIEDGTPCYEDVSDFTTPRQCSGNTCTLSTQLLTCKWFVGEWSGCVDSQGQPFDCISESSDDDSVNGTSGTQTRDVICTYQNNTEVSDSANCECDEETEPINSRQCNNFVCDFCRVQSDGNDQCHPNGVCNADKAVCECDFGFAGENCDIYPTLTWIGITHRQFRDENEDRVSYRADPYDVLNATEDDFGRTEPIPGVWSLTNATVGDLIGIRWNTTGDLSYLSVGWIDLQAEGDSNPTEDREEQVSWNWPQYLGIAEDKQDCDTDYQLKRTECDDFSFKVPEETVPGNYQIVVKFNTEFFVYSEVMEVLCSDYQCGLAGHGRCDSDDLLAPCICDDGWSGVNCDESPCEEWSFQRSGAEDAFSLPDVFPTCINDEGSCDLDFDRSTDDLSELCGDCSNMSLTDPPTPHYTGPYCEVPIDGCGTFTTQETCEEESEICTWHSGNGMCVYSYCLPFSIHQCNASISEELREEIESGSTQTGIGLNVSNDTLTLADVNRTWECQWTIPDGGEGYCAKKTCSSLETTTESQCSAQTLRRPFDDYTSICDAWFCDCSTARSQEDPTEETGSSAYWASVDSLEEFDNQVSSQSYSSLTCQACELACYEDSRPNDDCTECEGCPFERDPFVTGRNCKNLYWVIRTRVQIPWQIANAYEKEAFEALFRQDYAYLLDVNVERIGIWQLKGANGGMFTDVYWTYQFVTDPSLSRADQRQSAQAEGGEIFFDLLGDWVENEGSPVYRGFVTNSTDSSVRMTYCLPYFEECDPDASFPFLLYFLISVGSAFGLQGIAVLIYRFATRDKRDEKYEQRVEAVRKAQRALMAQKGGEAQRVGFRDVSKSRARRISKVQKEAAQKEERKLKDRAKKEDEMRKKRERTNHRVKDSEMELAEVDEVMQHETMSDEEFAMRSGGPAPRASGMPIGGGWAPGPDNGGFREERPSAAPAAFNPHAFSEDAGMGDAPAPHMLPLPPGWKMYFNEEHIPYYYNVATGTTTWRHPSEMM